jgi:ribosomal protein S18 acetylase RimI-like enzyme
MSTAPIQFRTAVSQDDVEAIHFMVASAGVFSAEEIDVAVELAEHALQHKEASDYRFLLAEREGWFMGYSCFGRIPLTQGRYDLYWIVVDGNVQQQGVASELLRATEAAILAAGGRTLYAETSSRTVYAPAQAFYRHRGFELAARLQDFYAKGDDKIIFAKILSSSSN